MEASHFTLFDVLEANARRHGARPAAIGAHPLSHAQLLDRCERLAAGLLMFGIEPGDRIAIVSHNRLESIQLIGAAARIGAIVSAINWRLSAQEVAAVLANDAPKLVVIEDVLWPLLDLALASDPPPAGMICLGEPRPGCRTLESFELEDAPPRTAVSADDPLLLIHTAWTDGRPKAAALSHRNVIANAMQLQLAWGLREHDVHLCCLPLFHVTALSLVLATLLAGGCSVLVSKFDPPQSIDLIASHGVTLFGEFAPMLKALLDAAGEQTSRLASLRHVCGLDSAETIRQFEAACPQASFWVAYGQSEASGMVTVARFREAEGSVGFPLPLCAVEVVDEAGRAVESGITGEIVLRGPTVFLGYWQRPADNRHVFRTGRLHTGDAGRMDASGRLWYQGRLATKELIKTGGENVYPHEVESVLRQHPNVADAAVIGVSDPKWGETVRAVCVLRSGMSSPQELIDFVGARIAHFKRPRSVLFADALPKNADGSHQRERIHAEFGENRQA